jgi:hypothetical protein
MKFSRSFGTDFGNGLPHTRSKVVKVCLWLRPVGLEKRTSAAKAVKRQAIYGTAEAVPFVKSFFPIWLMALRRARLNKIRSLLWAGLPPVGMTNLFEYNPSRFQERPANCRSLGFASG